MDYKSQKLAFRFNQKYPSRVKVFWIHDPLLEFGRKKRRKRRAHKKDARLFTRSTNKIHFRSPNCLF